MQKSKSAGTLPYLREFGLVTAVLERGLTQLIAGDGCFPLCLAWQCHAFTAMCKQARGMEFPISLYSHSVDGVCRLALTKRVTGSGRWNVEAASV